MSRIIEYAQNFLDTIGKDLGYDEYNLPKLKDIEIITAYHIPIWEYNGMTEEEYYKK